MRDTLFSHPPNILSHVYYSRIMKFTVLAALLSAASTALAQNIQLSSPTANATLTPGQNTTVQVEFPVS